MPASGHQLSRTAFSFDRIFNGSAPSHVRYLEDRRRGVLADLLDRANVLDAGQVLDRAADAGGGVRVGYVSRYISTRQSLAAGNPSRIKDVELPGEAFVSRARQPVISFCFAMIPRG